MITSEPSPNTILFARGVIARLTIWSTLRISIQQNWGGPESKQKSTWIASTIVDTFEEQQQTEEPDEQYIEEMLLQIMFDEFEVVLEDDSALSVAKDIVKMWLETKEGRDSSVKKFEELAEKVKGKKIEVQEKVDSDDDDDDWEDDEDGEDDDIDEEGEEVPQLIERQEIPVQKDEPVVDDDGFTLVKGKGKSRG